MKRMAAAVVMLSGMMCLATLPAAAQGRGQGPGGGGAPGLSGAHGPIGGPSGGGNANVHGGAQNTNAPGPKSPSELLSQNTQLSKNLASFFPAGTDLAAASSGFKNLGQFVAAVHVSHNLGIPFTQLKCTELGTTKATSLGVTCPTSVTNTSGISLGKSIQTIQPKADKNQALQDANREAKNDLKS